MIRSDDVQPILKSLLSGLMISFAVSVLVAFAFWQLDAGTYADRWSGKCNGWTKPVAIQHVLSDFVMWVVYIVIAVSIAKLHPIMDRVRSSKVTVPLIVGVFASCGVTHLLDAYSTFHPAYSTTGYIKLAAAFIGAFGAVLIAHDLNVASRMVMEDREILRKLGQ